VKSPRRTPFAKKSLGQNFLTDPKYIRKIIEAVAPEPGDTICEIGPGRGALTEKLVDSGASVIAIELDNGLAEKLRERFVDDHRFQLIARDALNVTFRDLRAGTKLTPDSRIKVAANLPYYISTAILQRLAEQRSAFSTLVLMFQKEVVERITAAPANSDRGFLTVIIEASFDVHKLFEVPPKAFRPTPKVQSAVVRLTPKPPSSLDENAFRDLVSSAFAQKRKTILNNLKSRYSNADILLDKAGIVPTRRAETLTLNEWSTLYAALEKVPS
jgi:16S rRNA (adenine1518-N6/adenine1519-N6)-dimethyltransferase